MGVRETELYLFILISLTEAISAVHIKERRMR